MGRVAIIHVLGQIWSQAILRCPFWVHSVLENKGYCMHCLHSWAYHLNNGDRLILAKPLMSGHFHTDAWTWRLFYSHTGMMGSAMIHSHQAMLFCEQEGCFMRNSILPQNWHGQYLRPSKNHWALLKAGEILKVSCSSWNWLWQYLSPWAFLKAEKMLEVCWGKP